MPPLFLVTEPDHFDVSYQINPWMQPDAWDEGQAAAARAGSDALRTAIRASGGQVESLAGVAGLPDLVFPANAAVVLDGRVMPAKFLCAERQGEEAVFRAGFEALKTRGLISEIVDLPDGVFQEGAGDAIWDIVRGHFWVGHGQRSNHASVAAIGAIFARPTVALELASPRFYHLDTCFCPLADGDVLYYPHAFTPEALAAIHAHVAPHNRIEATDEDAAAFCVNAVNIGRHVVMAKAPQALRDRLTARGYTLHEVDLAPYILSGGGAYCMTLRLDRSSTPAEALRAAE